MPYLLIDDNNYREFIGNRLEVDFGGQRRILGALARRTEAGLCKVAAPAAPDFLIPRDRWPELIAKKDEEGSWLADIIAPEIRREITRREDQNGLGYCWTYCVTIAAIVERIRQNHPLAFLSAESIGGPITGWRNRGGWPEDALGRLISHGACPQEYMDRPNSLSPSRWKDGYEEAALDYRATEFWDYDVFCKPFDAAVSSAIWTVPYGGGLGWWAHAIMGGLRVKHVGGEDFIVQHWNSWGLDFGEEGWFWLEESRAKFDLGLFGIRQMIPMG